MLKKQICDTSMPEAEMNCSLADISVCLSLFKAFTVCVTFVGDSSSSTAKASWDRSPWTIFQWDDLWMRLCDWCKLSSTRTNTEKVPEAHLIENLPFSVTLGAEFHFHSLVYSCDSSMELWSNAAVPGNWLLLCDLLQCAQLDGSQAATQWVSAVTDWDWDWSLTSVVDQIGNTHTHCQIGLSVCI